jgi:hypothetical protein
MNKTKCKTPQQGCEIGVLVGRDYVWMVNEWQFSKMRKLDKQQLYWFKYCPECGHKVRKKYE